MSSSGAIGSSTPPSCFRALCLAGIFAVKSGTGVPMIIKAPNEKHHGRDCGYRGVGDYPSIGRARRDHHGRHANHIHCGLLGQSAATTQAARSASSQASALAVRRGLASAPSVSEGGCQAASCGDKSGLVTPDFSLMGETPHRQAKRLSWVPACEARRRSPMAMTELDRDYIMLSFALTECRRAIDNLTEVDILADVRDQRQAGVEVREHDRIFDQIRLGLQMAANVSRLFWPPRNRARGDHLRSLANIPQSHALADRTLRNHIEHLDERLDQWTAVSPRPFLTIQLVLHDDYPASGAMRDEVVNATAILYDCRTQTVQLFGDTFDLPALRAALEDILDLVSRALTKITSGPGWTTVTG